MQFNSFEDFYPFYLEQHSNPLCRYCHYLGNTLALTGLIYSLLSQQYLLLLLLPVVGYGCAWIGHFVFEKNRPATFGHPLYSLAADWVMYKNWLTSSLK